MMNSILMQTVTSLNGAAWDWIFCGAFLLLLIFIGLYARAIPQGKGLWWGLSALLGVLVIAGMAVGEGILRIVLLDTAAFVAVALVWNGNSAKAKVAAKTYLILMIVAIAFLAAGQYLAGENGTAPAYPLDKIAAGLLIIGFSLKLALIPFYFWLPNLAEHSKPMTTVLVVSVVDIAAFSELAFMRSSTPWLFTDYAVLWLIVALLSMFGGALGALAQKNIKRMLAFSTIDDMGYLVLGTLAGTVYGLNGAMLAALSHAFCKFLLFGAVGVVENKLGHDLTLDDHGIAAQFHVSAVVFIAGALGMIGVPPLFGFIGRWRLYLSGLEYGGVALVLTMAAATALALLYYVRVIHRVWLGKPSQEVVKVKEPALASFVLIALTVILLVVGLFPGWLTSLIG
jgi:multicomponent Na+:H+ antiporter subunit D